MFEGQFDYEQVQLIFQGCLWLSLSCSIILFSLDSVKDGVEFDLTFVILDDQTFNIY